jgi:hypothetical protein
MTNTTTDREVSTMSTPTIIDVKVEFTTHDDIPGEPAYSYWSVEPIWSGVDRPNTGGWGLGSEKLSRRLERAIRAGAVCLNPTVATDVNGKTYVSCQRTTVMSKRANADLKRLGF